MNIIPAARTCVEPADDVHASLPIGEWAVDTLSTGWKRHVLLDSRRGTWHDLRADNTTSGADVAERPPRRM